MSHASSQLARATGLLLGVVFVLCPAIHAFAIVDTQAVPNNIAIGATATTNDVLWSDAWTAGQLVDGALDPIHGTATPVTGFNYTLDLGSSQSFDSIDILPRQDDCCPDRLKNFRVGVHSDDGAGGIGPEVWGGDFFTDADAPVGLGSRVSFTAADAAGTFGGQYISITSNQDPVEEYELQMAEIEVFSGITEVPINYATGAAVTLNGTFTWPGFPESNIVDGSRGTISHGGGDGAGAGGPAYNTPVSWEIDLGNVIEIDHLNLVNRSGCCPDRLTNFRVSVHDDLDGAIGPEVWGADMRTDLSDSGDGGIDLLTADLDPAGAFAGQWLKIELLPGAPDNYHLQLAEVEVFGHLVPEPGSAGLLLWGLVGLLLRKRHG